jgi:thioredoxin reductase (NADPH)
MVEEEEMEEEIEEEKTPEITRDFTPKIAEQKKPDKIAKEEIDDFKMPTAYSLKPFVPPPLSLLEKDKGKPETGDVKANANIIKRTLQNFGINVEMDERFGTRFETVDVTKVDFSQRPFKITTDVSEYLAETVIISTGANAKLLGIPSEQTFMGFGVSACATCDGAFYKDKKLFIVGGGDTCMEEAVFLTRFASEVIVVHRRDSLRASKIMQEKAQANPKIKWMWNSEIIEITGQEKPRKLVTAAKVKNLLTGEEKSLPIDGVFVAIGHQPNSSLFKEYLDLDAVGYIKTIPGKAATKIPGVFAAGDVQDHEYRQAITAAGSGCMAALEAERFLAH